MHISNLPNLEAEPTLVFEIILDQNMSLVEALQLREHVAQTIARILDANAEFEGCCLNLAVIAQTD